MTSLYDRITDKTKIKAGGGASPAAAFLSRLLQKVTVRRTAVFLTVLYILNLIPLLVLGHFDYASADDFSEGSYCHAVWTATHSITGVFAEAVRAAVRSWFNWMGYYGYMFMGSITPVVFGTRVYRITPWIMLGILTFSTVYLLHVLFVRLGGARKELVLCVSMITLLLSVECMPGANELIFWYGGAVNYTLFFAFSEILTGLVISLHLDVLSAAGEGPLAGRATRSRTGLVIRTVLISFFAFFTAGGNYLSALSCCLVLLLIVFLAGIRGELSKDRLLPVPVIVFCAGFVLSIAAPGNSVRAAMLNGFGPVKTIFISLHYFFEVCIGEMTGWALLMGFVLLIPILWKMTGEMDFDFPCPLIVLLFLGGLTAANFAPPLYAEGNVEAGRLRGTLFLQYVILAVLALFYAVGWVRKYLGREKGSKEFSPAASAGLLAAFLVTVFAAAMSIKAEPYYFTTSAAAFDLMNGSAAAYAAEWEERLKVLEDESIKNPALPAFVNRPYLLYYSDGTKDPQDWNNVSMQRFYNKESVIVIHDRN